MASLVEAIVWGAVRRISDMLISEAVALTSVKDDVESLCVELTRIRCFLEDADRKQSRDKRVQNWLAEVGAVAAQIEDVIDTYVYHANSSPIRFFRQRKLRAEISSIKDKLRSIRESRQTYQIEFNSAGEGGSSSLRSLRRSYPDDDDSDVVGLDEYAKTLKAELMKEEDRRRVVSVVGMGGLGKTTLVKKVYVDVDVKRRFDCCAWVFVSQQYAPREILSEILMQVGLRTLEEGMSSGGSKLTREIVTDRRNKREILKGLEDHELVLLVNDELREKRYLVVLDDIWSVVAWYSVQRAFPDGKRGSKVVFTTRIKEVAVSADPHSSPIEPPLLTSAESWELLRRKVFPGAFAMFESPLEIEQLGKEMVERCEGLPLAIIVLAGLLRTKSSLDGWKQVLRVSKPHVGKLRSEQQYGVDNILELSFQDLPYYLRPCFLYLGSFPEDSEIPKRKLIRLWIAEGFLPDSRRGEGAEDTLIEDVAGQCLEELVDRCMVQVGQWNHTRKGVKTCRLHDMMRDFCISKSKEENFFDSVVKHDEGNSVFSSRLRRIYIHGTNGLDTRWIERSHHPVRSLLVSYTNALTFPPLRKKNLALLRVLQLDFFWGKFVRSKLPVGIGYLIHLRYIRFSGASKTLKLPRSLGNLRNLVTLDLQGNTHVLLPSTISKLINLRHLLLPYCYSLAHSILRRINLFGGLPLTSIETLKRIYAIDLIRSKASLTLSNIRDLGVEFKCHEEYNALVPILSSQLVHLRTFSIEMYNCEFPNLKLLSQCRALSRLRISGQLSPENFPALPNTLSKLELSHFVLKNDNLAIMQKLPSLRILRLSYNSSVYGFDTKLVFFSSGFPKLEVLLLYWLAGVEEWEVEKGAMKKLERLDIRYMTDLVMLPEGLKHISSLRQLHISEMGKAFEDRLKVNEDGVEGDDFRKVRHVPVITISSTWEPLRLRF